MKYVRKTRNERGVTNVYTEWGLKEAKRAAEAVRAEVVLLDHATQRLNSFRNLMRNFALQHRPVIWRSAFEILTKVARS